jgi:anti-sigma B factor antagonist
LVGDEAIERLADEVVRVIEAEAVPRIVLNFERVQFVSSTMLGMLLTLYNRVRARGGQLRLAAVRKRHQRLLAVTRLDTLFEVYATPEQAAASLR